MFKNIDPKRLTKFTQMFDAVYFPTKQELHPWEQWFAWHPVKDVSGQWHWLKKIYRRYNWVKSDTFNKGYDYGTLFDVIRDS